MARVTAEVPTRARIFSKAVRTCVPKTTSLQLTVSVTTKLARLLQEQAVREIAVNRISTAIRSSLELPSVLQTTVNEVGQALGAQSSALCVEGEHGQPSLTTYYFRDGATADSDDKRAEMLGDMEAFSVRLRGRIKTYVHDGSSGAGESDARPVAAVPVIYHDRTMGVMMVTSDDPQRVWQDNEVMLLRTVADQVAVAVNHARLFLQMQHQALTDGLTGCFNRRFFEIQLERDLHLATRMRQPVSLILLDIDHFKRVNDTHGHDAGTPPCASSPTHCARSCAASTRRRATAARSSPSSSRRRAPRARWSSPSVCARASSGRKCRASAASRPRFGVATFPTDASSRELLVTSADRALFLAKRTGRNRVCSTAELPPEDIFSVPYEPVLPVRETCDVFNGAPTEIPAAPDLQEALNPPNV